MKIPDAVGKMFNVEADLEMCEPAEVMAEAIGAEARIEYLEHRKELLHAYSDYGEAERVIGAGANAKLTRDLPPAWRR